MSTTLIRDLIDLPEQVSRGDFVLRLTEGITRPEETLRDYVVTRQLTTCFDQALGLIKSALEGNTSKAAYLHGSFGSGKSHFMAVLHLLLAGNAKARSIRELSDVVARHSTWTEGKRFLLVPYHLIGARNLESAVLGHYVSYIRGLHPEAPTPAVYRSEKLLENADDLRGKLGDEKFFSGMSRGKVGSAAADGWGDIGAGWDAASYDTARNASPDSRERLRLVGDLIDAHFPAMRETNEFVDLDDGLAIISAHARDLGYDALVLFLDELILWLASHAANVDFVTTEPQKVPKLVESERADRPIAEGSDCVIVSTSTLELGIDVGDLDRVIQVDAPNTVASFLQRLGRTGRRPGTQRNCLFLATTPEALLRAGALCDLWQSGYVEPIEPPAQPLHILGQQLMALWPSAAGPRAARLANLDRAPATVCQTRGGQVSGDLEPPARAQHPALRWTLAESGRSRTGRIWSAQFPGACVGFHHGAPHEITPRSQGVGDGGRFGSAEIHRPRRDRSVLGWPQLAGAANRLAHA